MDLNDMMEVVGIRPKMSTLECIFWKAEHDNCKGCDGEVDCIKSLAFTVMFQLIAFDLDWGKMIDLIIDAQTVEDIHWLTGEMMQESIKLAGRRTGW